jgi:hypothetical protein
MQAAHKSATFVMMLCGRPALCSASSANVYQAQHHISLAALVQDWRLPYGSVGTPLVSSSSRARCRAHSLQAQQRSANTFKSQKTVGPLTAGHMLEGVQYEDGSFTNSRCDPVHECARTTMRTEDPNHSVATFTNVGGGQVQSEHVRRRIARRPAEQSLWPDAVLAETQSMGASRLLIILSSCCNAARMPTRMQGTRALHTRV